MTAERPKPTSITEYIDAAPPEARMKLREMRECIRKAAPGSVEDIKWGMPAFSYNRVLVMFAGFKNHIGFYPTPSAVKAFAPRLTKYKVARGSIQFPLKEPLPLALISEITAFRVKESNESNKKWKE